jgi:uncharacterized protein YkwD
VAVDLNNSASPQLIGRMLQLINIEREDLGLSPVESSVALNRAAQAHADDMAGRDYLDLRTPDGQPAEGWAAKAGYTGRVTTHIYAGPTSIAAVSAWMRSQSRTAILDPLVRHLGVGLAEGKWVLFLGDPMPQVSDTLATEAVDAMASAETPVAPTPAGLSELPTALLYAHPDTLAMTSPATTELSPSPGADPGASGGKKEPPPPSGTPAPPAMTRDLAVYILDAMNGERARAGLSLLLLSEPLLRAAQEHAEDMTARDYVSPISPEGEGPDVRAARAGYAGRCGQSVAMGLLTLEAAVDSLREAGVTRACLLNPVYQHLGVGLCRGRWALLFGQPGDASQALPVSLSGRLREIGTRGAQIGAQIGAAFTRQGRVETGQNLAPDLGIAGAAMGVCNSERGKVGLPPLAVSEALSQAAQAHSNDMAARNYFAYAGPDGQGLDGHVRACGYPGRTGANISVGQGTPEAAIKAMLANEGNRANILHPAYRHIGVGVTRGLWTVVFGIPAAPKAAASPQVVARVLELVNGERARAGVCGLALSDLLTRAAQAHAEDMARRNFAGSVTPEGEGVGPRVDRVGYRWRAVSESTAVDRPTPESVVEGWMKVGDHRQNLLDAEMRHAGVGVAESRWVVIFARQ